MNPLRPAPLEIVRTKIVATLGPASRSEEAIRGLVEAGVDVFRLNMAHGSIEEHAESLTRIRRVSEELARPVGALADLAGPKIRLGELPGGAVDLVEGDLGERAVLEPMFDRIIGKYFTLDSYYRINSKPVFSIFDYANLVTGLGGVETVNTNHDIHTCDAVVIATGARAGELSGLLGDQTMISAERGYHLNFDVEV